MRFAIVSIMLVLVLLTGKSAFADTQPQALGTLQASSADKHVVEAANPELQPATLAGPALAPRVRDAAGPNVAPDIKGAKEKPEQAGQIAKAAEVLASTVQSPLATGTPPRSALEDRYNAAPVVVDEVSNIVVSKGGRGTLEQYGYRFFDDAAGRMAPLTDAPVGPDYILGPGDRISVSIWGSFDGTFELDVNRSGEIILPRVGAVRVWGVAYKDLERVIHSHLAKAVKDFHISVNIGKLRTIKVFVVGEVRAPGMYDLSSVSTALHALVSAGGPTKTGSLRKISIVRGGQTVGIFDMYDFLARGSRASDIRLLSGDTIVVPIIGKTVAISGNIKRPAIYEIGDHTTLDEIFQLAGGLFNTAFLNSVRLARVEPYKARTTVTYTLDPRDVSGSARGVSLQDLDDIEVAPINMTLKNSVRLAGYVARPGDFSLRPGMRLRDLIGGEDNLLPEYSRQFAEITRFDATGSNPRKFYVNLGLALEGEASNNIELRESDIVRVFARWEKEEMAKVRIAGEVQSPGQYRLYNGMTVKDLVLLAGNLKKSAYTKNLEVTRLIYSGEEVKSRAINIDLSLAMAGDPSHNILLCQDDELLVRMKPNWADETEKYVQLKGEFKFPGMYPIYRGETLASVISRAGGYSEKAYLPAAKFTRRSVQIEQQKRLEEVVARSREIFERQQAELMAKSSSKEELDAARAALDLLKNNIERLEKSKAEGRVIFALKAGGVDTSSIEMLGGDVLEVPPVPNSVHVMGAVYNPASSLFQSNSTIEDYITRSGGMTKFADEDEVYIIGADGTVKSNRQTGLFGRFMATSVHPGDTIVVPQKLETTAWLRSLKDITTVISQVAITAGVVLAAGL